jgi:hypothetical protein
LEKLDKDCKKQMEEKVVVGSENMGGGSKVKEGAAKTKKVGRPKGSKKDRKKKETSGEERHVSRGGVEEIVMEGHREQVVKDESSLLEY